MRTILLACVLSVPTLPGVAEDWPQFRGPGRDNAWSETGVTRVMPPGGWSVRWRYPVQYGWASPVVAGGKVFVFDAELLDPKARERILCFEETSGKPLWTFAYDAPYEKWVFEESQRCGPSATPVVEEGRLYSIGACGDVHCLNAASGEVLWKNSLAEKFEISPMQCRASPLIEGRLLLLMVGGQPDACLVAIDKTNGEVVWHALDDAVSNSSPIVIETGGARQLVAWTADSVVSVNPETGATRWRIPMKTSNNDNIATPVFMDDRFLVSGLMLRLDREKPAATQLWPEGLILTRRLLSNTCTPCLRGDFIFAARSRGELVCLRSATGEVVWETDQVTDLKSGASLHLFPNGGDTFFLFNDQGELILAELTSSAYREIARSRLLEPTSPFAGHRVWVPPAFANRHVFARNDREIVCASLAAEP